MAMRLNRYLASASTLSRRAADSAITQGRVTVNHQAAQLGQEVTASDLVTLDGQPLQLPQAYRYLLFHKPAGFICSRRQQGTTPTIYSLLPPEYADLKTVGRLDRDSSGLLILTDDGVYAQRLSHPSYGKTKTYEVRLSRPLTPADQATLGQGVELEDGPSHLQLDRVSGANLVVSLQEGRNRQIRRTFAALGYRVTQLHRTKLGDLELGSLPEGKWLAFEPEAAS